MIIRARHIAIEGIDGSGKDTQLGMLARRLDRSGITPIILHEPSYGPIGREIRRRLGDMPRRIEEQRRLFVADRADHVARKIAPALRLVREHSDFAVLQNRCIVSAAAYQPSGPGDGDLQAVLDTEAALAPMPEIVLILDLDVDDALSRIRADGIPDSMEQPDRLDAVRSRYLRLSRLLPNCRVVDARGAPEVVAARVWDALANHVA